MSHVFHLISFVSFIFCFLVVFFSAAQSFCDFEMDFCDWSQGQNDNYDWQRTNEPTGTSDTGPNAGDITGDKRPICTDLFTAERNFYI